MLHDHVVYVSRNANNGTNAGTFNVNSNNDATNVNRNIGTQLAVGVTPENTPCPFGGKYANPITLGRAIEQRGGQQR